MFLSSPCTVNIFGSKSSHLSNRIIGRFVFIFPKFFAVIDAFSKWRVQNHQILQKSGGNEENLAIFTHIFKWPRLGAKMFIVPWAFSSRVQTQNDLVTIIAFKDVQ